ncbi:MAG: methylglyoxal synthase [Dehalococcoidales bacterium]|jgi:methylglyoxal synthase
MKKLTLALIAHDSKKEDMISLVKAHREELSEVNLVATKSTGEMIQSRLGLPVTLLQSVKYGGDQQVGTLVANGDVTAVIFLRDPLMAQPYEPKITDLLRVCDIHDVPLATNLTTGEAVIHLMFEHPEALSGHHLIAQYLEDMAAVHE